MNDKQLRRSFKNKATESLAFSNIAQRLIYIDMYGNHIKEQIIVYGDKIKTVEAVTTNGYKVNTVPLGEYPNTGEGYALAAEAIEHYFMGESQ